jgi:transglutaminase-like putative cysteine protease/tetratricopeptide (TPR) repeat protein
MFNCFSRAVIGASLIFFLFAVFMIAEAWAQAPPSSSSSSTSKPTNKADSEEAAIFERILNRVRFENDGTEVSETEAVIRIQSQAGVEEFGQLVFGYSSATEKLDIEYVRVRKPDGQVVTTPELTAQDFAPDVLKEAPMYSDYRQRHISVAALQPGDTLEYRTVTKVLTPLAAGNFWYEYTFPKGVAVVEDRLEINVPKAREVKLKTPARDPEIQETGDRRIYTWVVKDVHPEREKNKDEADEATGPDVQLTTFTDWKQIAEWYAQLQGERMTVDDSVRKKADDLTKGAETPTEKARRLYDFVARNVRYVSISLGIGRYQPHSASDVLQNGYGDCKDKHTLFSAMLRAEGIQSYPVMIDSTRQLDVDVPSPAQFDHVITAARLGAGPELTWLDTTPEVTPFGLILYQLRNKQAVVASDDSEGGLRRTPADSPVKTFMHFTLDGKFSEYGALDATLDITAQGDRDWPLRGSFRRFSQAQWKGFVKAMSASWGLPGDVDEVQLDPIEDTSKPFHLTYHLHQDQYFAVPSASVNFRPIPPLRMPAISAAKSTEPLNIGPAGEADYRVRFQFPANYALHTPTAVKMSRDYGEYSSTYSLSKGILEGERKLVVKSNELAAARRADYESFRNATVSDEDQVLSCTILTPSGPRSETASKMEGTPAELQKAGMKALQSKDYRSAIDLLKRAVDGDSGPNAVLRDGWYDLGMAHAGANRHGEAIAAFRKQIEIDSNHAHANGDLAMELQQTGKTDDAIAAYRKQLEITPYDKATLKNLGLLLAQLGRDADARKELEAAAVIPPDDPETKLALAQVYGRLGENAKSQELMKGLTGSAGGDSGQDIFAAALKDDIDPTQTENDAQQVLYDIGGQFDSGEFDRLGPSAFSSMRLVALAWARMGWAKFHRGENLTAMQFLNSAWLLSQSGTVANRLGQVFEKEGQAEKARHMYALAVAAGGSDVSDSRARLIKMAGAGSADKNSTDKDVAQAQTELVQARTIKVGAITNKSGSAHFNLVFDSSPRPERAEFVDGDEGLRSAADQIREKDFPVRFPDASSVKIIRRGLLSCVASGCSVELLSIDPTQ